MTNASMPESAFILSAGMGSRLAPYTDTMPKPLIPVGGKAMIDWTLDKIAAVGVKNVTVNLCYLKEQLQAHLQAQNGPLTILFSLEEKLLGTGGGIKNALYTMGDKPFWVFSGDTIWEDGPSGNMLQKAAAAWRDDMDLLLVLQPLATMTITHGTGDYHLGADGKPVLAKDKDGAYFWPSIRIVHPRLFDGTPDGEFSFLDLMKKAEANGRLGALVHDGTCYHISRPEDLDEVNRHLQLSAHQLQNGPRVA